MRITSRRSMIFPLIIDISHRHDENKIKKNPVSRPDFFFSLQFPRSSPLPLAEAARLIFVLPLSSQNAFWTAQ